MPNGLVVRLPEIVSLPSSEVGAAVRTKALWQQHQIPVPPLVVIPRITLKTITEHNKLDTKLEEILKNRRTSSEADIAKLRRSVLKLFQNLSIPQNIKTAFLQEYHHYLGGGFVHVSVATPHQAAVSHHNVSGDASVFESFLEVWAQNFFYLVRYAPERTPLIQLLLEQPIVIEKTGQPTAAGIAYTLNPSTLEKTTVTIYSAWGAFSSEQHQALDCFQVVVRSGNIISSVTAHKPTQLKRAPDNFATTTVPERQQLAPSLDVEQLHRLAQLLLRVKQQSMEHLKITWTLENHQLYIRSAETFEAHTTPLEHRSPSRDTQQTATKVYISTGNPELAKQPFSLAVDGVGIFRSEYLVMKLGYHPHYILNSKYRSVLRHEFATAIAQYQHQLHGKPFLFRSLNLTSVELQQLQFADQYENTETNPYLGYRGGMRLLTDQTWFAFELEVLREALKTHRSPIGLVLPFVRTPAELASILAKLDSEQLSQYVHFQPWLQLNTPANILNLEQYSLNKLAGVIINTKSLHGLLTGIDPDNPELLGRYPLNQDSIGTLISQTIQTCRQVAPLVKIMAHFETYQSSLAQQAISAGVSGLVVKPAVASRAKADIIDAEQQLLST